MIFMILLTSAVALLLWLYFHLLGDRRLQRRMPPGSRLPPMPPASSILGHVEILRRDFHHKKCIEWAKQYGPVIRLKVNLLDIVVLNDYESIKKSCNTKEILWRWPSAVGYHERQKGLNEMNGETWSANRRFCMSMLRDLGFAKTAMEGRMMEEFHRVTETIGDTNGKPVDVTRYVAPCAFNNMVSFFYGDQLKHDSSTVRKLHSWIGKMGSALFEGRAQHYLPWKLRRLLVWIPFTRSRQIADLMAELDAVSKEQIGLYKTKKIDENKDFLLGYIKKIEESTKRADNLFTDGYLLGNLNAFMIGGTFTTTITMTWHLLNFAGNPDTIQARVQREIDDVVGDERLPSWEDRNHMPYTLACIWEMNRWKTVAPLGVSRACGDDFVVGDFFIPKGTIVLPNLWAVHYDPALWKDPEKFMPERYLNEDGTLVSHKPEHLIPFSVGPRDCPGRTFALMEVFLLVTFLLQKYTIMPESPSELNLDSPDIVLSHATNLKVRFLPRKSAK